MQDFKYDWASLTKAKMRSLRFEAKRWVGTVEKGGDNNGQIIELFQKTVDGRATREPWCMSFLMYCIRMVDLMYDDRYQTTLKHKAMLYPSEHCMTVFHKSAELLRINEPLPGCLIMWRYYTPKGEKTNSGHAEVVTDVINDEFVETVGGNTSAGDGVNRDGDGVFIRSRNYKDKKGTMRVEGFILPWGYSEMAYI